MRFKLNYAHSWEWIVIRKFTCPFCSFTKNFYGVEAKRSRKRVSGFTCPGCGKKVTDDDIRRKKGKGPKPKEERRKRSKKKEVVETPIIVAPQPLEEQFVWRTGGPPPPGENRSYPVRAGWRPRAPKPTERTLGEALMVSRGINPSAPLPGSNPDSNLEVNEKVEENKYNEDLEKHEKKLALMIVRLDRVEERLVAQVGKLCESLEQLDSKIQAFSTLVSHMVSAQEPNRRRPR